MAGGTSPLREAQRNIRLIRLTRLLIVVLASFGPIIACWTVSNAGGRKSLAVVRPKSSLSFTTA